MPVGGQRFGRSLVAFVTVLVLISALAGCGRSRPARVKIADADKPRDATPVATEPEKKPEPVVDPKLVQSFAEATRKEPPGDFEPAVTTFAGKSVGKLYTQVAETWDSIRFISPAGKRIVHTATLETDEGVVKIELRPDWAPNHARNFVALTRVGYYDGLLFERVVHQQFVADDPALPKVEVDAVTAGCPLGTGEVGKDSLGYWLKPEFNKDIKHEEGIVAACHGEEEDTAGCRFYISLCKTPTPTLDGHYTAFGKVVQGLDIVRKMWQAPVRVTVEDLEGDHRPEKPIVITKATIETKEVDKSGPGGEN